MKKKILSLVLAIVLVMSFSINCFAFTDIIENHWAKDYIAVANAAGIVNGYGDGTFKPENKVKAGEFVKMVACVLKPTYKPVDAGSNHWAYQYVEILANELEGFDISKYDEAYELERPISRGDMSVILAIAYSKRFNKTLRFDFGEGVLPIFKDYNEIPKNLWPYINFCVVYQVLNGYEDRTFKVDETLTRAQACKVICKLLYS